MPLKLEFQKESDLLLVRASGLAVLVDMMDMIDKVAAEARRCGVKRVLVDQTQIIEDFKFTDHFAIGEKAASVFDDAFVRAASVVQTSRRTGTSEAVARRKGAALGVFTSTDAALAWLME